MKKVLVWKEDYEDRAIGQIERIGEASEIDSWSHHLKAKMESYPLNTPITDKPLMAAIVANNPGYFFKINVTQAVAEHWTKEGQEDQLSQPMIPERWSDGVMTVYSAEEVPLVDNEPDADFHHFQATTDDSWNYVPAVPYSWEIVDDQEVIDAANAQKALQRAVQGAIAFGQQLLVEFTVENVSMGITQDGMTKTVRQAMSEVMAAIQTGSLYDAIDEIDLIPEEAKDGKYITDERLQKYKAKIQEYLS